MRSIPFLLLSAIALFNLNVAGATSSSTCMPMFNHVDDLVPKNNGCDEASFQSNSTAGTAKIVMDSNTQGDCVVTTAVECDGEPFHLKDIASIDFNINVPAGSCNPTEWIAVYMFPWCGKPGGCWQKGEYEVDFVETTGPNGDGGFASNWDSRPVQVPWKNNHENLRVNTGANQHITFTSSPITSGPNTGRFQWDIRVCDASASKCDASNSLWHAYRNTGPSTSYTWEDSMMIVVDDWGVRNAPKKGCTLEVTDMVITKY